MKNLKILLILSLLFVSQISLAGEEEDNPNAVVAELIKQIKFVNHKYELLIDDKEYQLKLVNSALKDAVSTQQKVDLLVEKDFLKTEIKELQREVSGEVSKIRYLKGLQIIKILYEKVLSLDHHFASVRTLNEINKISNPNQYPEYEKLKDLVSAKKDKKTG